MAKLESEVNITTPLNVEDMEIQTIFIHSSSFFNIEILKRQDKLFRFHKWVNHGSCHASKDANSLTAQMTVNDILNAFSKLCRKSIVPKYLKQEIISQFSIQSNRGPQIRVAAALRQVHFYINHRTRTHSEQK
jgi:hypothetical protein